MAQISIVGTSHIARQSVKEVENAIFEFKPDIVAIELDFPRYQALTTKKGKSLGWKDIKYIGIKGFLFAIIGEYVEKKLGRIVNTKPGADMLAAIKTAKKLKIAIALIDQPIAITLRKFSKAMSWKEKWNIFVDVIKGLLSGKREMKKLGFDTVSYTHLTLPTKRIV